MLPLPHTLAKARRLWHHDFNAQCARMPLQPRTRIHAPVVRGDGTVLRPARIQRYYVQPKPAPSTAKDLMTDLVFMSLRALEHQTRRQDGNADRSPTMPEAPALSVNCQLLGQRRSLSARTVRTHLALLLQMGAIARKAWHGTRANFELWINPKYLWESPALSGDSDLDRLRLGALLQGEGTKLPLSVAFETLETKKLKPAGGDKLITSLVASPRKGLGTRLAAAWGLETRATPTRNTGPQLPGAGSTGAPHLETGPGPGARLPSPLAGRPSRAQQQQWVATFWAYAQPRLYPGGVFTEAQHVQAHRAIWQGVFAGFPVGLTDDAWRLGYAQALQRVDLVAGWLARKPERYLPAPYAEIVAGWGYFDEANARGFVATRGWLAQKMHRQWACHTARVLRRAAAELRGWRLQTATPAVLALTLSQLYQHHLREVTDLNDPAALKHFLQLASGQA